MSLLDTPLWEVIKASFSPTIWKELVTPIVDTLYITGVASLIVLIFGILLGILLTATSPDGVFPLRMAPIHPGSRDTALPRTRKSY